MSTRQCALYFRQSISDEDGIARQEERTRALATMRGWTVVETYVDDDISASKPRGPKTAWGRMLADAKAGRFDVVVGVDLDRVLRSTRDLNTLIDHNLMLVTVDGEIDLTTADGEFRATMLAGIARFEVRRKAERQIRANLQRRESGVMPMGTRLTGYTQSGELDPIEAPIVRQMFERFIAGQSMRSIADWLEEGPMPARNGRRWEGSTVRMMLLNQRYAGRQTYKKQPTGRMGNWEPIVSEATFDTAFAILKDPRRLTRSDLSTARKHLGTGLYKCAECGGTMRSHGVSTHNGNGSYGCANRCLTRSKRPVDDYVRTVVAEWLRTLDLDLSPSDAAESPNRLPELRARLAQVEQDYFEDLIDARVYGIKRDRIAAEIELEAAAHRRSRASAAASDLLAAADPGDAFLAAPLGIQRTIIDEFLTVTLSRGRIGGGKVRFDPATIVITPRKRIS